MTAPRDALPSDTRLAVLTGMVAVWQKEVLRPALAPGQDRRFQHAVRLLRAYDRRLNTRRKMLERRQRRKENAA